MTLVLAGAAAPVSAAAEEYDLNGNFSVDGGADGGIYIDGNFQDGPTDDDSNDTLNPDQGSGKTDDTNNTKPETKPADVFPGADDDIVVIVDDDDTYTIPDIDAKKDKKDDKNTDKKNDKKNDKKTPVVKPLLPDSDPYLIYLYYNYPELWYGIEPPYGWWYYTDADFWINYGKPSLNDPYALNPNELRYYLEGVDYGKPTLAKSKITPVKAPKVKADKKAKTKKKNTTTKKTTTNCAKKTPAKKKAPKKVTPVYTPVATAPVYNPCFNKVSNVYKWFMFPAYYYLYLPDKITTKVNLTKIK